MVPGTTISGMSYWTRDSESSCREHISEFIPKRSWSACPGIPDLDWPSQPVAPDTLTRKSRRFNEMSIKSIFCVYEGLFCLYVCSGVAACSSVLWLWIIQFSQFTQFFHLHQVESINQGMLWCSVFAGDLFIFYFFNLVLEIRVVMEVYLTDTKRPNPIIPSSSLCCSVSSHFGKVIL